MDTLNKGYTSAAVDKIVAVNADYALFPLYAGGPSEALFSGEAKPVVNTALLGILKDVKEAGFKIIPYSARPDGIREGLDILVQSQKLDGLFEKLEKTDNLRGRYIQMVIAPDGNDEGLCPLKTVNVDDAAQVGGIKAALEIAPKKSAPASRPSGPAPVF